MIYQLYPAQHCADRLFSSPLYCGLGLNPEVNPDLLAVCPDLADTRWRTALAEYVGMLFLWRCPPRDADPWLGVTSYRQRDKIDLELLPADRGLVEALLPLYDVLGWGFYAHNMPILEQAEFCHPGIADCLQRLLRRFGYDLPEPMRTDRLALYCNYWILTREAFSDYMQWSWPMVEWIRDNYHTDVFLGPSGQDHFGPVGFIVERLFIVWYYLFAKRLYNLETGRPIFFSNSAPLTRRARSSFIRQTPRQWLIEALQLLLKRGGRTVVEVGSIRHELAHPESVAEGRSTALWAWSGVDVVSIDTDPRSTQAAVEAVRGYPNVRLITADGIEFLRQFRTPIDLLYLDAWDLATPNYQERHLEAYEAALPNLHQESLILVDDTDVDSGGKGRLVVEAAERDGFQRLLTGRQTLLARPVESSGRITPIEVSDCIWRASRRHSRLSGEALELSGMSSEKVRHLLNNLCGLEGVRYLEIGLHAGSTFCAALDGNHVHAIGVDNWSQFNPEAARSEFEQRVARFRRTNRVTLIYQDAFSCDPKQMPGPVNVFFYDGDHDVASQRNALVHFEPLLADRFVLVVDDYNMAEAQEGTQAAIRALGLRRLFEEVLLSRGNRDVAGWWNGLYVAVLQRDVRTG